MPLVKDGWLSFVAERAPRPEEQHLMCDTMYKIQSIWHF